MALWVVRAGNKGQLEAFNFENDVAAIGWEHMSDLSNIRDPETMKKLVYSAYDDRGKRKAMQWPGQLWDFLHTIEVGDTIILPRKERPIIAVARVVGRYRYAPDAPYRKKHQRPVKWLRKDVPRHKFDDIEDQLRKRRTVFQIFSENAEERFLNSCS